MQNSTHSESFDEGIEEFDLRQLLVLLYRRKWWIILFMILGAGAGLFWLKLTPPVYEATALVDVPLHQRNVADIGDRQSQEILGEDALKTIESNLQNIKVFLRIAKRTELRTIPAFQQSFDQPIESIAPLELAEMLQTWLKIKLKDGTRQISVKAEHNNPELAATLANLVVEEYIQESEETRLEELRLAGEFLEKEHNRITVGRQKANQIISSFEQVETTREKFEEQKDSLAVLKAQGKGELHPESVAVQTLLAKYGGDFQAGMAQVRLLLQQDGPSNAATSETPPSPSEGDPGVEFERLKSRVAEITVRGDEFQATLEDLLSRRTDNAMAIELPSPPIRIATDAYPPSKPVGPKKILVLAATTILGLGLGIGMLLGRHIFDRSLKTVDEAERVIGLPVLTAIPNDSRIPASPWLDNPSNREVSALIEQFAKESATGKRKAAAKRTKGTIEPLVMLSTPGSPLAEAFRTLRASFTLMTRGQENQTRSLLVTSSVPGEGKSFVAANLAIAFAAQEGKRTLLVDADLRRPMVDRLFNSDSNGGGLTEALSTGHVEVIASGIGNLDLLPAGRSANRPAELLSGDGMGRLVAVLLESYDQIIFDSAPINTIADGLLLAPHVDASILVARAGKTPRAAISHARNQLADAGVAPVGLILNRLPGKSGFTMNPYYYYYDGESRNYGDNYK